MHRVVQALRANTGHCSTWAYPKRLSIVLGKKGVQRNKHTLYRVWWMALIPFTILDNNVNLLKYVCLQ